jgi:ribulose-phosphate 3-epimerase
MKIFPSILSADFGNLADEVKKIEKAKADGIHIDVMDGHFVPNLTLGPKIVASINKNTSLFLDVHLMMYNAFDYIEAFVKSGADRIVFHLEATEDVEDHLNYIKTCNVQAGIAINPETPIELISKYLDKCDMVLIMTVHPGFGGQKFIKETLDKIAFVKKACEVRNLGVKRDDFNLVSLEIQVDGGINPSTAKLCIEKGANSIVSGDYIFSQSSLQKGIDDLRNCMSVGI